MEKAKLIKIINIIDKTSKILLAFSLVYGVLFFSGLFFDWDIVDRAFDIHLLCFGFDLASFALFLLPWAALPLAIVLHYVAREISIKAGTYAKEKISTQIIWAALTGILIAAVFGSAVLNPHDESRYKARNARRLSDLRQIESAQEAYYQKYGYYAASYRELAFEGIMPSFPVDPVSGIKYADDDGVEIEGGDDDSQTWSVKAALEDKYHQEGEICRKDLAPQIYICNENGCNYENR